MKLNKYIVALLVATVLLMPTSMGYSISSVTQQEKVVFVPDLPYYSPPTGTWNPFIPNFMGSEMGPGTAIYEPLAFWIWSNDTWIPALATGWTESAAKDKVTVSLRQGVKWHDGKTFTSKDVIATFYTSYVVKTIEWDYLDRIEAPDNYTVIFYFKKPTIFNKQYVLIPSIYSYSQFGKFSDQARTAIAVGNTTGLVAIRNALTAYRPEIPIGTGPYTFKSQSDTETLLAKFSDYWRGAGNIHIDEIRVIRFINDATADTYLYGGTTDFDFLTFTKETYDLISKGTDVRLVPIPEYWGGTFLINCQKYPLNIKEVRQAIAWGTNVTKCELAVYGFKGWSAEASKWHIEIAAECRDRWLTTDWMKTNLNYYEYNPAKAKALLDALNFIDRDGDGIRETTNGTKLEFVASGIAAWEPWPVALEAMAQTLAPIGIKVTVYHDDSATRTRRNQQGDFGIYQTSWSGGTMAHPYSNYYTRLFSTIYRRPAGYAPIGMDPIVNVPWIGTINASAYAVDLSTKFDPAGEKAYVQALAYVMNQYLPSIEWYQNYPYVCLNTKRITGWPANANDPFYASFGAAHWGRMLRLAIDKGMLKPKLTLTLSVSPAAGGTISPAAGVYERVWGDTVSVTVTVATGYEFDYWQLDGVKVGTTTTTYAVTMDKSHELIARFRVPPAPPTELYAAIAVFAIVAVAGWAYAVRRKPKG